jgi:hypothetical protein
VGLTLVALRIQKTNISLVVSRAISARPRTAGTLTLERTLSDLVNQAYALTPAEIALMWQTAPPRMPIPPPGGFRTVDRCYRPKRERCA